MGANWYEADVEQMFDFKFTNTHILRVQNGIFSDKIVFLNRNFKSCYTHIQTQKVVFYTGPM